MKIYIIYFYIFIYFFNVELAFANKPNLLQDKNSIIAFNNLKNDRTESDNLNQEEENFDDYDETFNEDLLLLEDNNKTKSKDIVISSADPLEKFNNQMFRIQYVIDKAILNPLVKIYQTILPKFIRTKIKNVFTNIFLPKTVLFSLLQLDFTNTAYSLFHFLINTTIGLGGIFKPATYFEIPQYNIEDFGQVLANYGVPSGPYLFFPLFGPGTLRFTFSRSLESLGYNTLNKKLFSMSTLQIYSVYLANGFVRRSYSDILIKNIMYKSFNPYIAVKESYLKKREHDIRSIEENNKNKIKRSRVNWLRH